MAGEDDKTVTDVFNVEREADTGVPVPPPAIEVKKDEKEVVEPKAEDFEKSPLVAELRSSIETLTESLKKETGDKAAMGQNLSKMRERLEKLEKGDKEGAAEPVFKDIKHVKDLPKEKQEEMSETERTLFDTNADMQERINKLVGDQAAAAEKQNEEGKTAAQKLEAKQAFETKVQSLTLTLADGNKEVANKIIAEFNAFAGNDKLDDAALQERLAKAAKLVPEYVPKKEQPTARGSAAAAADSKEDPHGVGKIVEDVQNGRKGGSFTL